MIQSIRTHHVTEAIDQVKSLTRRTIAKDALWDVEELTLKTLRNKFNSGLWLLKALCYAEPIRLVTIGRWMSRIDKETTEELNALDAYIQMRDEYDQTWSIDDVYKCTHQHSPKVAAERQNPDVYNATAIDDRCKIPPVHNGHRNDTRRTTKICWPPTGECQSCGFHPWQRAGEMCVALAKTCTSCGTAGHMEKACKGKPKSATIKPTPRADLDDSTEETDKVGGMGKPDDQTGHANSRREMHPPQENTPEMQNDEKQCNIGPTMSGNSTITNRDEIPRNTITYGNSATTSANASSSSGYPRQGAELHSKPTIGDQTNTNYDAIKTYLRKRLFEAIPPAKNDHHTRTVRNGIIPGRTDRHRRHYNTSARERTSNPLRNTERH